MYGALLLFDEDFVHVISITFTSLILTELLMVTLTIRTWHWLMIIAQLISLGAYIATLVILKNYFGKFSGSALTLGRHTGQMFGFLTKLWVLILEALTGCSLILMYY